MAELPKNYEPSAIEPRWYAEWTARGYFHADAQAPKAPFAIVIPPPNVTGSLHMGHALGTTIEDIFTRWRRMAAYNAMWLPGTDHAGIATQMVVERELKAKEGKTRHDLGRDEFVKRIWEWRGRTGDRILEQLKTMGSSLDWERTTFTMEPQYSAAVIEAFVRLYEEGLIYRAKRLINWCPQDRTALSDLEVDYDEGVQGELYEFAYPLADGSGELIVATTRPETMLGDTAVAVHPDDPRHKSKIGKMLDHPFVDRQIPVIADPILVDPKFGTGAVKVTPAHDPNDFETGLRHQLPMISIFDEAGIVNAQGGEFAGLDRFKARKAVKARLAELRLERGSKPHVHAVGHCQRCETVVEPMLSTQWFVKMEPLAKPAIEAVEQGKTKFVPESWSKTFFHWMNNIRDWCISRQLWWGHRIPAWYCGQCQDMTIARTTPNFCGHCGAPADKLQQDDDVLDTWFSSWLWPFATLGWPNETRELKTFYPTTVLDTGYDILFFWVARMLMAGLHFMKKVPFRTVYLHTMVTDEKGNKMSKVKGNTIDPVDVIKEHGADSLRFALAWLTTHAAQGKNIKFSIGNVEDARRFANKIWNSANFVKLNLEGYDADRFADRIADGPDNAELDLPERWILSRVQRVSEEVDTALEEYRIADAAQTAYHFVWNELCDWYIELAKAGLKRAGTGPDGASARLKIQGALVTALETSMRLLHPFMPFITEEIWQQLPKPSGAPQSIMITLYPVRDVRFYDDASEASMALVQKIIVAVRAIRTEKKIPGPAKVVALLAVTDDYKKTILEGYKQIIAEQVRCSEVRVRRSGASFSGEFSLEHIATTLAGDVEVMIPLEGLVDPVAETGKLEKDLAKLENDLAYLEKKHANPKFLERAPLEVLDKDRAQMAELRAAIAKIQVALERLQASEKRR
ncbi:MAG TPA: valine--tRNA ligase [Polyangia bacterium]|nr:valine--tRNA ligase [Polyangia bacterium]